MADAKLIKTLLDIGLNEKEARVYLAALSLGPTSILKLADEAGIKRTTVYSVLEALRLMGLITVELRGFKRRYVASPPSALRSLLFNRLATFDDSIGDFMTIYNMAGGGSVIRHYQGLAATRGLYEELLASVRAFEPYCVLTDLAKWQSLEPTFFKSFVKRRARKSLKIRILSTHSKLALARQMQDREHGAQVRILPKNMTVNTNLVITPHYLAFHQLVPPFDAILLNNKSVIGVQMEMFNALWQSSMPDKLAASRTSRPR